MDTDPRQTQIQATGSLLDSIRDDILRFAGAWGGFGAVTALAYVALLPLFRALDPEGAWLPWGGVWLLLMFYPAVFAAFIGFVPGFAAGLAYAVAGPRLGAVAACAVGALTAPPLLNHLFVEHGPVIASPGWWYVPSLMLTGTFSLVSWSLRRRSSGAMATALRRSGMQALPPLERLHIAWPLALGAIILAVAAARMFMPL